MYGVAEGEKKGVVPRALDDLFSCTVASVCSERFVLNFVTDVERRSSITKKFQIRAIYLLVLNDTILDLLRNCNTGVKVVETEQGVIAAGATNRVLTSPRDIFDVIRTYVVCRVHCLLRVCPCSLSCTSVLSVFFVFCSGKQSLRTNRPDVRNYGHTVLQIIVESTIDDDGTPYSPRQI